MLDKFDGIFHENVPAFFVPCDADSLSLGVADGPVVHVAAASCAGFTAASLSAPADALMTQCAGKVPPRTLTCPLKKDYF